MDGAPHQMGHISVFLPDQGEPSSPWPDKKTESQLVVMSVIQVARTNEAYGSTERHPGRRTQES